VVYAIAVLGFNLLTGFTGQVSLGHGAFFAMGAYAAVISFTKLHVPYALSPVIAGVVCLGLGTLFGRSVARLEGLYLALATFALAVATPQILKLDALDAWTGGSQGINFGKPRSPVPAILDDDRWLYFVCLGFAVVLYLGAWNLLRGSTGRALVALRDHQVAAATVGIDVASYKATTFGVSAMYTGVAGALGAIVAGFVAPDSYTIFLSIQILVGGVVGGITSIGGAIFGGAFIEIVPDLASKISDAAPWALYGTLLIVCIMAMPGGVAGLVHSGEARVRNLANRR
jgi:branched-chain amino acid transport system permease protein